MNALQFHTFFNAICATKRMIEKETLLIFNVNLKLMFDFPIIDSKQMSIFVRTAKSKRATSAQDANRYFVVNEDSLTTKITAAI